MIAGEWPAAVGGSPGAQPAYLPNLVSSTFRRLSPKSCGFLVKCFRYIYYKAAEYRAYSVYLYIYLISIYLSGLFWLNFNERPPGRW